MATGPVEAVKGGFITGRDGKNAYPKQMIKVGQKFLADDPRVRNNKTMFLPVDEVIERATAVPGEKRETKPKPKPKPRQRASDRNAKNKAAKQAASTKAKKAEKAKGEKERAAREKAEAKK